MQSKFTKRHMRVVIQRLLSIISFITVELAVYKLILFATHTVLTQVQIHQTLINVIMQTATSLLSTILSGVIAGTIAIELHKCSRQIRLATMIDSIIVR